jgi:hypothetical protein
MKGSRAEIHNRRPSAIFRLPVQSDSQPEKSFRMLAIASAIPSMTPMILVLTPRTLARNSGRMLMTISLEMSIRKLVRLTAHTLRGSCRRSCNGRMLAGCGGELCPVVAMIVTSLLPCHPESVNHSPF